MENNTTTNPTPNATPTITGSSHLPPKKTIFLIIVLVLITFGLVYLAITMVPQTMPNKTTTTADPLAYAQTHIRLSSNPREISSQSAVTEYGIDVNVDTGKNKITAVQLELNYDPKALSNVDLTLGTFNKDWTELIKKIDPVNGTISYAVGINLGQRGISGRGSVATITFTKNPTFTGKTTISFQPKTQATAEGIDKSVLRTTVNTLFSFPEVSTSTSGI